MRRRPIPETGPTGASPDGPLRLRPVRALPTALLAGLLAGLCTLLPEAYTVPARGGDPLSILRLWSLGVILGVGVLAVSLPLAAVGGALGAIVTRIGHRLGYDFPPSRWVAGAIAIILVLPMHNAHLTMVKHVFAAVLASGYAVVMLAFGGVTLDRLRPWFGARPRRTLALVVVGGVVLHVVNAMVYTGLYREMHEALTAVTAACWLAIWWALLDRLSARVRLAAAAIVLLSGAATWFAADAVDADRAAIAFFGTESDHVTDRLAGLLDADGDGLAESVGGRDCNDDDPAVHPLAFEVPGNGVDENCRLGDAPRPADFRLRPPAPPLPEADAWRLAHPGADVVMIFVDTLRWDAVNAEDTPAIHGLAQRSVVFSQARTTVGRTPHAWMTIIRARFLERVMACRSRLVEPGSETLVHRMKASGRKTLGRFIGKSWPRYRLAGGWDRQIMAHAIKHATGGRVVTDVKRMLRENEGPAFVVAHFADPHIPYLGSKQFPAVEGDLRASYRAEVRTTDVHIGRLLDTIEKRGRPTVIVLFADHGENLGDHGQLGGHHGGSVFDEVLRVPLMISAPDIAPGVVDAPVSVVDIAPTLIELVGARPLTDADGRSLTGYLFGQPPEPAPLVGGFFDFGHRLRTLVDGRFKLIVDARTGGRLLYDVVADPYELRDLVDVEPEAAERLTLMLDRWIEYDVDPTVPPARCPDLGRPPRSKRPR